MSAAARVRIEIEDHVALVALNRPEKHNALDLAMFDGIVAAAEQLQSEPGVRAVVLHGEGPSFCSGLDVVSVMSAPSENGGLADPLHGEVPNRFQRAAYGWIEVPVPVIAAIHGNCLGGGLQIALAADIRVASPEARMSVMEVKWGLIPDMSITRTLPRLVGIDVAKELTMTARVFSGDEAHRLGVVTHVAHDPLASAETARLAQPDRGRHRRAHQ
jgi:enoyl-CoA hydratase/carnithine racemase